MKKCLLVILYLFSLLTSAEAQTRSDWFNQAKYGVIGHWFSGGSYDYYNNLVTDFDVQGLAQQLDEAGAGYYILTLGQNDGYFAAPNPVYDDIVGGKRTADRDLVEDLYQALNAKGIKLMLYFPSNAPQYDDVAKARFEYTYGPDQRNANFQRKWESVIRYWSNKYGSKVSGWWFDGAYWWDDMYAFTDEPNFTSFAAAARSGNPNATVSFNDGWATSRATHTRQDDIIFGEIWRPEALPLPEASSRWLSATDPAYNTNYQVQWHLQTYLGHNFGGFGYDGANDTPRFTDTDVIAYMRRQIDNGGVITWDVPMHIGGEENGKLGANFMNQLKAIKAAFRTSTPPGGGGTPTLTIANPGFEADNAYSQTPQGWSTWSANGDNADYSESYGGAHSGTYHGTHWKDVDYEVYTYQLKTGLANGSYKVRAWVKNSGGQNSTFVLLKHFDSSDQQINTAIPVGWEWTLMETQAVNVTNGQLEFGFYSNAHANNAIYFDDVELIPVGGGRQGERISLAAAVAAPNPFSTETAIALDLPDNSPVQVHIFSAKGQGVSSYADKVSQGKLLVGKSLERGFYLLRLQTVKGLHTIKIIKE